MTQGSGTLSALGGGKSFSINAILAQLQNATKTDGGLFSSFLTAGQTTGRSVQPAASETASTTQTAASAATSDLTTATVRDLRALAGTMRDFISRAKQAANDARTTQASAPAQTAASRATTNADDTSAAAATVQTALPRANDQAAPLSADSETDAATPAAASDQTDATGEDLSDVLVEVLALLQQVVAVLPQLQSATSGGLSALSADDVDMSAMDAAAPTPLAAAQPLPQLPAAADVPEDVADQAQQLLAALQQVTAPRQTVDLSAQTPTVTDTADSSQTVDAATLDALVQSLQARATTKLAGDTIPVLQPIDAGLPQAETTATVTLTAAAVAPETDPLTDLLQALRDDAKALAQILDAAATTNGTSTTTDDKLQQLVATLLGSAAALTPQQTVSAPQDGQVSALVQSLLTDRVLTDQDTTPMSAEDLAQLLAVFTAKVKDTLTSLHFKAQVDAATADAQTTTAAIDLAAAAQTSTQSALASVAATVAQTIAASTDTAVAAQTVSAAGEGLTSFYMTQAARSSGQEQTQPTAAQVFANASAMVAAAESHSGASSGDADLLSGGRSGSGNAAVLDAHQVGADVMSGGVARGDTFSTHMTAARNVPSAAAQAGALNQVSVQITRAIKSGNDTISMRLHPAEMGTVTVRIDIAADGKVQGVVTADNPQTLEMLQKDSRNLERALQDAGLRADPGSLQFSLDDQAKRQQGQQAEAGQGSGDGTGTGGDGMESASGDEGILAGDADTESETYYITPTGVNIRV